MNWSDIGRAVGSAAPMLGTLLGGPAGAAVGALVASALGTRNDPDAVNAALAADPSALARVQELQINAKVELQRIDAQARLNELQAEGAMYTAEASDRDSARKLAAQQPNDIIRPAITLLLILGAFGILIAVFGGYAEGILKDTTAALTAGTVIGFWFNELKQTLGFYFGMTRESQKQNAIVTSFAVEPGTVSKPDK